MPHPHHTDANELGSVGLKGQDLPPKPELENTVRLAIPKSNCDPGVYNKVSTMSEAGNGHFDQLTARLSPEQRSEFFQALHEAGIAAHDVELAQLLRALQLYKAFYEEIPSRLHDALTEAHVLADDIKTLLDSFLKRLDTAVTHVGQTTQLASDTLNQLQALDRMLAAAVEESTTEITGHSTRLCERPFPQRCLHPSKIQFAPFTNVAQLQRTRRNKWRVSSNSRGGFT